VSVTLLAILSLAESVLIVLKYRTAVVLILLILPACAQVVLNFNGTGTQHLLQVLVFAIVPFRSPLRVAVALTVVCYSMEQDMEQAWLIPTICVSVILTLCGMPQA
jgi:hypothetical protein